MVPRIVERPRIGVCGWWVRRFAEFCDEEKAKRAWDWARLESKRDPSSRKALARDDNVNRGERQKQRMPG